MRGNLHFIPHCNITRLSQSPVAFTLSASTIWTSKAALIDPLLVTQCSFSFHFLSFSSTLNLGQIYPSPPRQPEGGTVVQQMQDWLPREAMPPPETRGLQKSQCLQHAKLPVAWSPCFWSFWFQTLWDTMDPALSPSGSHFSVSTSSSWHDAALIYEKTTTKTSSRAFTVLEHGHAWYLSSSP